jgi:hypothetical protein
MELHPQLRVLKIFKWVGFPDNFYILKPFFYHKSSLFYIQLYTFSAEVGICV